MTNSEVFQALEAALCDHIKDDLRCLAEEGLITEEQFADLSAAAFDVGISVLDPLTLTPAEAWAEASGANN